MLLLNEDELFLNSKESHKLQAASSKLQVEITHFLKLVACGL